ncbi:DUF1330 domain-containing protein [Sneathiella aquimaris]|uniref:DUF1330 domain-containing protein n=1 Tax=Sneathiella aquimaris TaxID=2599305 RepID=UPI00146B9023|nr:DUF1330 domain-containing protein [Sneathiella aquimaris]
MSVQFIALISVKHPDKMNEYKKVSSDALAKHQGKVLGGLPAPEALEATGEIPDVIAILEFPSIDHARAWRQDPDLAPVHALRNGAGSSTILALPALK